MAIFADRAEAGRVLADALAAWRGADAVVFGIARGGVVVAAEVAQAYGWPLEAAVVRKLGATGRPELAIGAIAEGVRLVSPDAMRAVGMSRADLERVEERERRELARRTEAYRGRGAEVRGRVAIVIDDGIATGMSAHAACRAVRGRGAASTVLATPVAPAGWTPDGRIVDQFVCAHRARDFRAVGQYYDRFADTSDGEVVRLLGSDLPA